MNLLTQFQYLSTLIFALAILHTFFVSTFNRLAKKYESGSFLENLFHLLGEVEIVFGLWSGVLVLLSILMFNFEFITNYLNNRNFNEPLFVFVIMVICSTQPILDFAEIILLKIAQALPLNKNFATYFSILFFGPLLGSLITEPAAMTICAFLLLPRIFDAKFTLKFKYATLALLFINVSLGGTLTPFAAPPVLMVAEKWQWGFEFMLTHFAPKTIFTIFCNTSLILLLFKNELSKNQIHNANDSIQNPHQTINKNKLNPNKKSKLLNSPFITLSHLIFLALVVLTSHHPVLFIGIFMSFIGFLRATHEYQTPLKLKEPLMVGFFLAGLVVLGGAQSWWLEPLVTSLSTLQLYFGSIGLTAIVDNAALTYLGSLIPNLTTDLKLALVSGSVIGGGLTIIANAPNPAGFGIVGHCFNSEGFSPLKLFLWSLPLTTIAALIFIIH